jgi:hypothetical protein
VDTDGHLLMVNLTAADVQDAAGAEHIVKAIRKRWPWLKHLFADGAYDRGKLMSTAAYHDFVIEGVRKLAGQSVDLAYVDQGYTGQKAADAAKAHGIALEVIKLPEAKRGFVLLPTLGGGTLLCLGYSLPPFDEGL